MSAPIRTVHGIGDAVAERLERLEVRTVGGLLRWYPREYVDASQPVPVAGLPLGRLVAVRGTVIKVQERPIKGRKLKILEAVIEDETGKLKLRWFNQGFLKQKLELGSEWVFVGVVGEFKNERVMTSPLIETEARVLAVYAQTKGVTSKMLRGYIGWCLEHVDLEDGGLPVEAREFEGLRPSGEALRDIHRPASMEAVEAAREQLGFEEAFWFFVRMALALPKEDDGRGKPISPDLEWLKAAVASLPFELTYGQRRAIWDSLQDMASARPMTRLLNGDVGSGKTAVAALIAASVARNGYQSALLVPTEILASQHAKSIANLLDGQGVKVGLYTASHKDDASEADILVGTHALLQSGVELPRLAFVAVDEQHRFGVRQRQALREGRKVIPHLLSMTATPIPRTLALALYGDLSISLLPEKPKDRLPIRTEVVRANGRPAMYARIQSELDAGRQVFVICPLIEEKPDEEGPMVLSPDEVAASEKKTVVAEVERLRKEFPGFGTIEMLHGKMKAAEKDAIMRRMAAGEIAVLVATSVVEVGVDVPNATVMVIEGAERFGLAQLHQFRGRVGRSSFQSYCFLCPSTSSAKALERLRTVASTESGFDLAQADLDLRGPGEMVGQVQSGLPDFRMASLTDTDLLLRAKAAVDYCAVNNPLLFSEYSKRAMAREMTGLE